MTVYAMSSQKPSTAFKYCVERQHEALAVLYCLFEVENITTTERVHLHEEMLSLGGYALLRVVSIPDNV